MEVLAPDYLAQVQRAVPVAVQVAAGAAVVLETHRPRVLLKEIMEADLGQVQVQQLTVVAVVVVQPQLVQAVSPLA